MLGWKTIPEEPAGPHEYAEYPTATAHKDLEFWTLLALIAQYYNHIRLGKKKKKRKRYLKEVLEYLRHLFYVVRKLTMALTLGLTIHSQNTL